MYIFWILAKFVAWGDHCAKGEGSQERRAGTSVKWSTEVPSTGAGEIADSAARYAQSFEAGGATTQGYCGTSMPSEWGGPTAIADLVLRVQRDAAKAEVCMWYGWTDSMNPSILW